MLREIRIRNLAIVEDASDTFHRRAQRHDGIDGRGEIDHSRGGRSPFRRARKKSLIRKGATNLTVEGIFSVDDRWPLRERLGLSKGETELSLTAGARGRRPEPDMDHRHALHRGVVAGNGARSYRAPWPAPAAGISRSGEPYFVSRRMGGLSRAARSFDGGDRRFHEGIGTSRASRCGRG